MVEIAAGAVVLSRHTVAGSNVVAAWPPLVALTSVVAGSFDVAVRDLVMAVGAVALAQLEGANS